MTNNNIDFLEEFQRPLGSVIQERDNSIVGWKTGTWLQNYTLERHKRVKSDPLVGLVKALPLAIIAFAVEGWEELPIIDIIRDHRVSIDSDACAGRFEVLRLFSNMLKDGGFLSAQWPLQSARTEKPGTFTCWRPRVYAVHQPDFILKLQQPNACPVSHHLSFALHTASTLPFSSSSPSAVTFTLLGTSCVGSSNMPEPMLSPLKQLNGSTDFGS